MTRDNAIYSVECWWLWKEPVVQDGWLCSVSRCSKWCPFAFMFACNSFLNWLTTLSMAFFDMLVHVSMRRCFKSLHGHSSWCRGQIFVQCLYSVHTFLHQFTNSVLSTGLFGGHRSGQIKSGVSCWRSWTVSRT